jgi:hypothetical protein
MQRDGVGDIRRVCFCRHGQHCGSKSQGAEQDRQGMMDVPETVAGWEYIAMAH